ncbi:extracellular solute-binding protein [Bradyrhizobium agreste]|uniref:extracellular solute-binding protein n=1 Tax=Bradyrhizobium agreste TaxID=2751811 RepID=UPI001FE9D577|nr:extracellular solute-binding protein [Bradyrhizobium agreste]
MSPYGVGTNVYTTVLAYRTDAFKGRKAPQSWADFWNVSEFPGRRAVRKHPFDTIEEALMGAGTPAAQVYPCDLDKAFASLDKTCLPGGPTVAPVADCKQSECDYFNCIMVTMNFARRRVKQVTS